MKNDIRQILEQKILVLDGAMGTMIQRHQLNKADYRGKRFADFPMPLQGNNDLLSLTQPEIIKNIHLQYLQAGADIIETNTFNANGISMLDYDMCNLVYEMNYASAQVARQAISEFQQSNPDIQKFVAGSVGPTNKTASMSPDVNNPAFRAVTFNDLVEAYTPQIEGHIDGGADLLLIETVFDTLNCKAALMAADKVFENKKITLPLMVSVTITDKSGRTFSGQTPDAFLYSVMHAPLLSFGFNCALGAKQLFSYVEELAEITPFYFCLYPNAGLPNAFGKYEQTGAKMAEELKPFLDAGLINIIGGCCGTTPDHIQHIAALVKNYKPRIKPKRQEITTFSGLEPLKLYQGCNFVNIGERTNVAGSKKFARLIREQKYEEALSVARDQVENGAQMLDISMDDAMLDAKKEMTTFLNMLAADPDISRVPIVVDSSKFEVIEAALQCIQGKALVNSISLKEGETVFKKQALTIKKYGAAVIVMAFDEKGQADTFERKIEICKRAYKILTSEVGFYPENIVFDSNILAIATGIEKHNAFAVNYINAVKWIKTNLPGAKVSGGVSNLSFSFRGNDTIREAIHSVFLYHAINAGMDMGIVNASALEVYDNLESQLRQLAEDVVLNRRKDATDRLITFAEQIKNIDKKQEQTETWRDLPVDERLTYALIKGITDYIETDIALLLPEYPRALQIIEGPLMAGMNKVGQLFGDGKMFLPQVVKSARVMKKAVNFLLPYIEKEKGAGEKQKNSGKIILATVKGDVHDIGKNIVGVVLACNNFEVIDLGVMVPTEKIITAIEQEKPDFIGLSGLITPSLDEMIHVAKEMQRNNINVPLLIGGATTTKLHTAVKIAPNYHAPVIHVHDASQSVGVVNQFNNANLQKEYIKLLSEEYEQLRNNYEKSNEQKKYISLSDARKNKLQCNWKDTPICKPNKAGISIIKKFPVSELIPYIDWTFFFHAWKINGRYPAVFDDPVKGKEAKKLFDDAQQMLQQIISNQLLTANAVIGLFPANSKGDDVIVYSDDTRKNTITTFSFLRNQQLKEDNAPNLCLADFIAPVESGITDYIGMFAATAGIGADEAAKAFQQKQDDYSAILLKILASRLAEALAEYVHEKVRKEYWSYAAKENLEISSLLQEKYSGIRPAAGYPACPVHEDKFKIFNILKATEHCGMQLTENAAMLPEASVCGWYFAHPQAKYFTIDKISKEQVEEYAKRCNISLQDAERRLNTHLNYL